MKENGVVTGLDSRVPVVIDLFERAFVSIIGAVGRLI